mgnify:CR=1 FL=1
MSYRPRIPENDDRFTGELVELAVVLDSDPREEGSQPVVIRLAVDLVRMMVTTGALNSNPEKHLGG